MTPRVWVWSRCSCVPAARWSRSKQGRRGVPDDAVVGRVGTRVGTEVVLAARPFVFLDGRHQGLVVGVDHQRQARRRDRPEDAEQLAVVVDADAGHVRVVAPGVDDHEHLERGDALLGECRDLLEHRAGSIDVPVDDGAFVVQSPHRGQPLGGVGRRIDVGHREGGGDAARCARRGGADDVLLVGEARLAVVAMDIDDARQEVPAGGVDGGRCDGRRAGCQQGHDATVRDGNVRFLAATRADQGAATDEQVVGRAAHGRESVVMPVSAGSSRTMISPLLT